MNTQQSRFILFSLFFLGCPSRSYFDHLDTQNIKTLPPTQSIRQKNTLLVKSSPKDAFDISLVHRLGSTKFHSAYSIFRLALSPDERILAAGFRNTNQVKLWDTYTGQELALLRAGEQPGEDEKHNLTSLAFSPDGKYLAVGLFLTSVEIFEVKTAKHVASYKGSAAAFSPNGNHLVIADTEEVFVRSFPGGELLATWPHLCAVNQVLFSSDGVWVAIGGYDGVVFVWEAATGRLAHKFQGYVELVRSLAFTPDSRFVVATNRFVQSEEFMRPKNHELHLWELASNKKLRTWKDFELGYPVIEFDPSRSVFYAGDVSGKVLRRSLSPNVQAQEMYRHSTSVNDIVLSPSQSKIYSASDDGIVRCWDLEHDKDCLPLGHRAAVMSVAFSPDGKTIASAGLDHTIRFWDTATGDLQSTWATTERFVDELDYSPDGQFLLARGTNTITTRGNPAITVWNLATKQQHCQLEVESSDYYSSMVIAPDGTKIALCANDPRIFGFLDFWDIHSCSQVREIPNEKFNMSNICWLSNETVISMGHEETAQEKTIQFWNLSDAKKTKNIELKTTNARTIQSEACSPTGSFVATFDGKQSILQLWDINSGELEKSLPGPIELYVRDLIISPNEKIAVSVSDPIVVWDLETGAYKTIAMDDHSPIESIAFSPDSCLLVGASGDSTIFVWKLSTSNCKRHGTN